MERVNQRAAISTLSLFPPKKSAPINHPMPILNRLHINAFISLGAYVVVYEVSLYILL